jgi:TolB-like protein/class 3 adenylate cyclase/Flp pilus assembly protein TadD
MAAARVERRLAAIMAADVVGYSALMERDEDRTLARLKAHRRELVEPLIAEYQGRVIKLMGDGLLAEFASVVDATRCAVLIQRGMAEREAAVPEAERVRFRIGVNLGDVIRDEDGDLYGDGVNLAARLEQLAEPGGVMVSGTAYDHLQGKLELPLEFAGEQRVKNIERLVRAYRVRMDGKAIRSSSSRMRRVGRRATAAALGVFLLAAAAAGGWWWHQAGGSALPAKPSLAVLPLANLSGDPRWERLADGITEDIITDLARDPDLHVIARNSTMAYKGEAVDVRRVGQELGVRYVLEGSLQAEAGRVRVTAQLIDAATGGHLWAERYDRPEADLFAIQDEVARSVAGALGGWYGRLAEARRGEAKRRPPASLDAYDLYLLGLGQKHKYTKESMAEAIRLFSRAVELDPGFARGWTMLGLAYNLSVGSGFADDPSAANRLFVECTKKAAELDPFDPFTQAMLGSVRGLEGDLHGAEVAFDRAVALAPNDPNTLVAVTWSLPLIVGRAEEAVQHGRRAMALDPASPAVYAPALAVAQYAAGEYEEAVAILRLAPLEGGEMLMYWAMAHAQLGHVEEARAAVERIRSEFPGFTVEGYIRDFPVTAPPALAAIREGAAKAGLLPAATQ